MKQIIYFSYCLMNYQKYRMKYDHSHVISTNHHEYFFNKITKLIFRYSIISILINLIKNIINLLSCWIIDANLFRNLYKNLLKLSTL